MTILKSRVTLSKGENCDWLTRLSSSSQVPQASRAVRAHGKRAGAVNRRPAQSGAAGDLAGGHPRVQPQRHRSVKQIVGSAANVKPDRQQTRPVRARPWKTDGYTDRPGGPDPVRYTSVDPRIHRHPPAPPGTDTKQPASQENPASGAFSQRVAGVGFEPT
jgi:hypothetical protein